MLFNICKKRITPYLKKYDFANRHFATRELNLGEAEEGKGAGWIGKNKNKALFPLILSGMD